MNKFNVRINQLLATGLYTGYLPGAPGTWGSLIFIPIWIGAGLLLIPPIVTVGLTLALALITSSNYLKFHDKKSPLSNTDKVGGTFSESSPPTKQERVKQDPQVVVIDEWAGMAVSLYMVPATAYLTIFVTFLLFRVFDTIKPGPIKMAEKLPGALGIVADDVVAGLFVLFIVQVFLLQFAG